MSDTTAAETADTGGPVKLLPQQAAPNYVAAVLDRLHAGPVGQEAPAPELLRLYALIVLVKGRDATLRDVHDARAVYADMCSADANLLPYEQLPRVLTHKRYLLVALDAIHKAARDECRCNPDAVHHYADPAFCRAATAGSGPVEQLGVAYAPRGVLPADGHTCDLRLSFDSVDDAPATQQCSDPDCGITWDRHVGPSGVIRYPAATS